jgi:hypothetical protein
MANYSLYARSAALLRLGMVLGGQSKKRALAGAGGAAVGCLRLALPGLGLSFNRGARSMPVLAHGVSLGVCKP